MEELKGLYMSIYNDEKAFDFFLGMLKKAYMSAKRPSETLMSAAWRILKPIIPTKWSE